MTSTKDKSNNIKHGLFKRGLTLKSFAEKYGFKFRDVSDVVRGIRFGNYGTGREIREKLEEVISQGDGGEADCKSETIFSGGISVPERSGLPPTDRRTNLGSAFTDRRKALRQSLSN